MSCLNNSSGIDISGLKCKGYESHKGAYSSRPSQTAHSLQVRDRKQRVCEHSGRLGL